MPGSAQWREAASSGRRFSSSQEELQDEAVEVLEAVADGDFGDAVGAGEFLACLVIVGDVRVRRERPDFFDDLVAASDGVRFGDGKELLEPSGRGDHDDWLRVAGGDTGEVDDDSSSRPVQVVCGRTIEHAL